MKMECNAKIIKAKLEKAIELFIQAGAKPTRLIEFEFPACEDGLRSGKVEKMLVEKYPDASKAVGWYYIQATPFDIFPSKIKGFSMVNGKMVETIIDVEGEGMPYQCLGFSTFIMEGCEPMNIALKNQRKNLTSWHGNSFCKTQFARDFEKAHLLVCDLLDILEGLGFTVNVSDEAGYYGTGDAKKQENQVDHGDQQTD